MPSSYFIWIAGVILALTWFSRVVEAAIGMRRVTDISQPEWDKSPATPFGNPTISIVVPARNEEEIVEAALKTLLALDYPNYEVIAVDDRSTDATGEIMERVAREHASPKLRVIHLRDLPNGWLGKTHAMWRAAKEATGDWLLFTDADVLFKPDSVRRAVAYAEAEGADHLVLFPQIIMRRPGEYMMIAFFNLLLLFGHRPWKVADPKTADHIGVGAFNLVRRGAYEAVGTYEALRMEVIDDMRLGKVVKNGGFAQRNVFGPDLISIRWADGAMGVIDNFTKNIFALLQFQVWRTLICIVGLAFLNLTPFLGIFLVHGWARVPYAVALASIFVAYVGNSRLTRIPAYYFFLHPISTALFVYILLRSMLLTLLQGGVIWRGTKYPLEELRKGLV